MTKSQLIITCIIVFIIAFCISADILHIPMPTSSTYTIPNSSYELSIVDDSIYVFDHDRRVAVFDTASQIGKVLLKDNE